MTTRIDKFMVESNLISTRTRAQNLINLGAVMVNGIVVTKPSQLIDESFEITITDNYDASLGSIKLKEAIKAFSLDIMHKTCLDIGAANGGFTEVLLKSGAEKVYALDVGECALPDYLKNDKKVVAMKVNARFITKKYFDDDINFCVADVSFISLKLILPAIYDVLAEKGAVVALIKPQFECGKKELTKNGIVKDIKTQQKAVQDIINFAQSLNFTYLQCIPAPHPFENKNQEYLLYLCK